MNSRLFLGTYIFIVLLLVSFPFLLDVLIKNGILSFSPGDINSWIDFSGSYVGAIIGASVVFFVAIIQTKKQNEQQINVMKTRAKYELQREMKFFHTTILMRKIEETLEVTDEILNLIPKIDIYMKNTAIILTEFNDEEKIANSKLEANLLIKDISILANKIGYLNHYIGQDKGTHEIITRIDALKFECENINQHYEKYYIDQKKVNGPVYLSTVAIDARNITSNVSIELTYALTNIQGILTNTENNN